MRGDSFMTNSEFLTEYMVFLIPLALIQVGLMIGALIHILTHDTYKTGNRAMWIILSVLLNTIGPILYICIGASHEKRDRKKEQQ